MRTFAWGLMLLAAVTLGCKKPDETIPEITPTTTTSGTTVTSGTTTSGTTAAAPGDHADDAAHDHADGHVHEGDEHASEGEEAPAVEAAEGTEGSSEDAGASSQEAGSDAEEPATGEATEGGEASGSDEESAQAGANRAARLVSTVRLEVPDMMCPYSCYPAVKKTLAKVPGVEEVELAKQPEGTPEGEIRKRVVELKVKDGFDISQAITALSKANYEATVAN
ncbi:MAG: hypothetical protein KatS3mg111_1342 [Pirellulaceae bacterium]|nr:MAG: hypothetical protein KatS3mg111_1342 [Pirellulaceae bacterium]